MSLQDRHFFFKPYRQRIHEMVQHHDSLEQSPEETSPSRPYFGHSPQLSNNRGQYSPSRNQSQGGKRTMKQFDYNNRKKHTRLDREMHEPIWQHLYNHGLKVQKQIMQNHNQKKFEIDTECTFQPMIRKSSRYRIPTSSNFLQRNYLWQENKLQKIVKQKQEQVVKDLENCTFKPRLNNYKLKTNKYHHLKPSKSMNALQNKNKTLHESALVETKNKDRQRERQRQRQRRTSNFNKQEVGKIKNIIRNELKRIQL